MTASVTLSVLADGSALLVGTAIVVPPGKRRSFHVNTSLKRATAPVLVISSEAVIVERDLYRLKGLGLGMGAAIPLR